MLIQYLIIFAISMVPLIELRGAIPIAVGMGLDLIPSYLVSVVGNLIPVPFILIFIKLVLSFMKKRGILVGLVEWIEKKAVKGADKINRSESGAKTAEPLPNLTSDSTAEADGNENGGGAEEAEARREKRRELGALIGLFLFVAIPLPGTGAWTGALVAALFGMNRWKAFGTIALGVFSAGVIMALASFGVLGALKFLL